MNRDGGGWRTVTRVLRVGISWKRSDEDVDWVGRGPCGRGRVRGVMMQ